MCHVRLLSFIAVASSGAAIAGSTIRLPWTTDHEEQGELGKYGPDGPWQALSIRIAKGTTNRDAFQPMWPGLSWITRLLKLGAGGEYTVKNTTALGHHQPQTNDLGWYFEGSSNLVGNPVAEKAVGDVVFESLLFNHANPQPGVNATIWAFSRFDYLGPEILFSGQHQYAARVGTLGLGQPTWDEENQIEGQLPDPILRSFKKQGKFSSEAFSAHIGSAALNQPGSLILGGYEQHRALGPVGIFSLDGTAVGADRKNLHIIDISLGTEIGGSPFANGVGDEGSMFPLSSSTLHSIDAEVSFELPYLYLPKEACQKIADRLHLVWEPKLQLYLWNESDSGTRRVISSPAYLAFTFREQTNQYLTVKVPLRLLDLTLQPPLVTAPTRYFPCRPTQQELEGPSTRLYGILGRAFLQAAFFAADFQNNITYLAQAPGPDMVGKSSNIGTIVAFNSSFQFDGNLTVTNPIEEFEKTWLSSWTVLPEDGGAEIATGDEVNNTSNEGLPISGVIGVSVGVIAALGLANYCWLDVV